MPNINEEFSRDISSLIKGQAISRDDVFTGFDLRVTATQKAFIAECKFNGINRTVTIGRYGAISADSARSHAEELIGQMTSKRLPSRHSVHCPTLKELLAIYSDRKPLRPATVLTYSRVINGCLSDWLDKPITVITEEMVQTRHKELSKPNHMGTIGHDQGNSAIAFPIRWLQLSCAQ